MSTVSINTNITVDSYEVVDDLNIVDEAVQVEIVDALFTSTQPDWDVTDPNSPYYIKHKPTKTSDFTNDGNGTSRFVLLSELTDQNRVNDVQVKLQSTYQSVLENKIAKIDLSNYVNKELKTGSQSAYKVLSDNNFTDAEKLKVSKISTVGDGSQALTNDGTYKNLYNILTVNGVAPVNQAVTITPSDIQYNNETLANYIAKLVPFNSAADKSITLDNNKFLYGKSTLAALNTLIGVNSSNLVQLGSNVLGLSILSSLRPTVNSESMAYLSDITSGISSHNSSNSSHQDIRNSINALKTKTVMQLSNAEMLSEITSATMSNGQLVVPKDSGTYTAGKIYKFIVGETNSFELQSNYQVENIYRTSAPTTSTVGIVNQLCYDVINLKVYRCSSIQTVSDVTTYTWSDITPAGSGEASLINAIINNTQLISDAFGGFTAGNNYRLLDSDGIIPIERMPQAVLQGMTYGGSFGTDGVIHASSSVPAIEGIVIDNLNKLYYKNHYFLCTGQYTLDGVVYTPGNFALSSGYEWVRISNAGQVISVNNKTGAVVLTYTDVNAIGTDKLVTSWSTTTLDVNVPSEKLVKNSIDSLQQGINSNTQSISAINTTLSGYGDIVTHNTSEFLSSSTQYVSSVNGNSGAITGIATTNDVNAKYTKPNGGIPKYDLASDVQTSLGKADTAVQDNSYVHTDNNFTNTYKNYIEANNAKVSNVQSDWNATSGLAAILNKPTIPTVNDATLSIQKNGTLLETFTANSSTNKTVNITVPTKTSDVTNDSGFITKSVNDLTNYSTTTQMNNAIMSYHDNTKADVTDLTNATTRITTIEGKIPSAATSSNQLADKAFVNSSIQNMAAFYVTKRTGSGTAQDPYQYVPFSTKNELDTISTVYIDKELRNPGKNDYAIVLADESKQGSAATAPTTRYIYTKTTSEAYDPTAWEFQYVVNNTGLTAVQIAALNSGITSTLVEQITTNQNSINSINTTISSYGNIVTHNTGEFATSGQGAKADTAIQPNDNISQLNNNAGYITDSYHDSTKADKSTISDYTLIAANWSNNSYTLSVTGKTASNNARVSNSNTGTDAVVKANAQAIADANIYKIVDNGTSLTFICETTPTVNLAIQVEVYQ